MFKWSEQATVEAALSESDVVLIEVRETQGPLPV